MSGRATRVLITGGTGFVGRHLLDQIAAGCCSFGLSDVVVTARNGADVGHQVELLRWDESPLRKITKL